MIFYPHVRILNSLSPRVFGCIIYVYQTSPNHHKLEPKALKCIFISYSPTQKEYKYYCPLSQKFFVSCDVTFVENESYHSKNLLQREESHWDPTISVPIPLSFQNTNLPPIDASDHSQPILIESTNINSFTLLIHQQAELMMTDPGGELCSEKAIKVYSRRPKGPTPQLSQLLELDDGPTSEEHASSHNDLDLPIAIQKGVRLCVKYPISNYLTYSRLSAQFKAFTTTIDKSG